jgi:outer membrane lipoprotein
MRQSRFRVFLPILLVLMTGCGSVLSKDALYGVNYEVDYNRLKASPETHLGKTVILGGMILANEVADDGSTLEILKYTLDKRDEPQDPDEAGGRFLVHSSRLLDPSLYKEGRLVTLTGTLRGVEVRPLQKARYAYPLFEVGELYLWPEPRYEDRYPYYPYFYDPFPYWYRYPYWHGYPYWW